MKEHYDSNGKSYLHHAALHNAINIIDLLINEWGIDKEHKDKDGQTALYFAARKGYLLDFLVS